MCCEDTLSERLLFCMMRGICTQRDNDHRVLPSLPFSVIILSLKTAAAKMLHVDFWPAAAQRGRAWRDQTQPA